MANRTRTCYLSVWLSTTEAQLLKTAPQDARLRHPTHAQGLEAVTEHNWVEQPTSLDDLAKNTVTLACRHCDQQATVTAEMWYSHRSAALRDLTQLP
jgi:hypothetical protein